MPKIPSAKHERRLSDKIIESKYLKIKNAALNIDRERIELTGTIDNTEEALRYGSWNEAGLKLKILAALAANPKCYVISLADLHQIIKKIETPEQARPFSMALAEVLDTKSISFLISKLLKDDYEQYKNQISSFLRVDDSALEALITSLIRKEVRFQKEIQDFLSLNFRPFLQKTLLILLHDYLFNLHQGKEHSLEKHEVSGEVQASLLEVGEQHLGHVIQLAEALPETIKMNCRLIAMLLKEHRFNDKIYNTNRVESPYNMRLNLNYAILGFVGSFFIVRVLGIANKDFIDHFWVTDDHLERINIQEIRERNFNNMFDNTALLESLNAFLQTKECIAYFENQNDISIMEFKRKLDKLSKSTQLIQDFDYALEKGTFKDHLNALLKAPFTATPQLFFTYALYKLYAFHFATRGDAYIINVTKYSMTVLQHPLKSLATSLSQSNSSFDTIDSREETLFQKLKISLQNIATKYKTKFSEFVLQSCLLETDQSYTALTDITTKQKKLIKNITFSTPDEYTNITPLLQIPSHKQDLSDSKYKQQELTLRNYIIDDIVNQLSQSIDMLPNDNLFPLSNLIFEATTFDSKELFKKVNSLIAKYSLVSQQIQFILSKGREDFSPLYYAIYQESSSATEFLLGHANIDIDEVSFGTITPLYLASYLGREEYVKLLLKHKADASKRCTPNKLTPLMIAIQKNQNKVVKVLLNHYKEKKYSLIEELSASGGNLWGMAVKANNMEAFKLLTDEQLSNDFSGFAEIFISPFQEKSYSILPRSFSPANIYPSPSTSLENLSFMKDLGSLIDNNNNTSNNNNNNNSNTEFFTSVFDHSSVIFHLKQALKNPLIKDQSLLKKCKEQPKETLTWFNLQVTKALTPIYKCDKKQLLTLLIQVSQEFKDLEQNLVCEELYTDILVKLKNTTLPNSFFHNYKKQQHFLKKLPTHFGKENTPSCFTENIEVNSEQLKSV